jgi:hypothetical protein
LPKSLDVFVIRAIRPSSPSNSTANPIASAARLKYSGCVALPCTLCVIA